MKRIFSHQITVDLPIEAAFPLFTPRGEEAWVPDWRPTYIDPADGETRQEMLFTTGAGEDKTFWTCLAWEPAAAHVRYLRLTPSSRVAIVDVQCMAEGRRTLVRVRYEIQPLTEAGVSFVDDLAEEAFAESINEWADLIAELPR